MNNLSVKANFLNNYEYILHSNSFLDTNDILLDSILNKPKVQHASTAIIVLTKKRRIPATTANTTQNMSNILFLIQHTLYYIWNWIIFFFKTQS